MTLERDLDFLQKHGLMDYSLLLGIEKVSRFNNTVTYGTVNDTN